MTTSTRTLRPPRPASRLALLALLVPLALLAPAAHADEGAAGLAPAPAAAPAAPPAPPADWVARAADRYLTRENLTRAVVWRVAQDLLEKESGPVTILRQLVEERVVRQEARRLGLAIPDAELDQKFQALDADVRRRTNGAKTLVDVIVKEQRTSVAEFRDGLRHQLLREKVAGHQEYLGLLPRDEKAKLAQIDVVIGKLMSKAKVEYGVPTALQDPPSALPAGAIATVNGEPITFDEYGSVLVERLPTTRIKDILQEECKAVLTAEYALTPEQMQAVIAREKERWNKVRTRATQEAYRTLEYEDWVKLTYRQDVDHLQRDRYFRGLYGLVQHEREAIIPEEVRREYEAKKDTVYGERIVVTDIQIRFEPQEALLGPSAGRNRKAALQLANDVLRRHYSGIPFADIVREVNAKQDSTFLARRLSVRDTGNERLLYEQAKILQDGQVSRPFETLAEVHVIERVEQQPAPSFSDVEDMVRESLAFARANAWLEERLTDPARVEIRWPPAAPR